MAPTESVFKIGSIHINQPVLIHISRFLINDILLIVSFFFRKSLKFFRGPNYDITAEIDEIKEKRKSKVETQGEKISAKQILKNIFSKSFLKPFSCVGVIFVCSDWSGHNAFLTYMIKVLRDTGFTKSQAKIGPIIAGSIRLFLSG